MKRTKRGRGRPSIPAAEKKARILSVRLTAEEEQTIEAAARALGLKPAAYVRLASLHASVPPPPATPKKEGE